MESGLPVCLVRAGRLLHTRKSQVQVRTWGILRAREGAKILGNVLPYKSSRASTSRLGLTTSRRDACLTLRVRLAVRQAAARRPRAQPATLATAGSPLAAAERTSAASDRVVSPTPQPCRAGRAESAPSTARIRRRSDSASSRAPAGSALRLAPICGDTRRARGRWPAFQTHGGRTVAGGGGRGSHLAVAHAKLARLLIGSAQFGCDVASAVNFFSAAWYSLASSSRVAAWISE